MNADRSRTPVPTALDEPAPCVSSHDPELPVETHPAVSQQASRNTRVETFHGKYRRPRFIPALPVIYEDAELAW